MMDLKHLTINDLVGDVKHKINELEGIVDVLLMGYRTAAEMIDDAADHRVKYIDQLKELNELLGSIIATHPATGAEKSFQNAFKQMADIVEFNSQTSTQI